MKKASHLHLKEKEHKALAIRAADYAEHMPGYFEEMHPQDGWPRKAIEAARVWVRGEQTTVEACKAAEI
jgi:hypothetical protein